MVDFLIWTCLNTRAVAAWPKTGLITIKALRPRRVQLLGYVSYQALLLYIPAPGCGLPIAASSIAGWFQAEMAILVNFPPG